jgi:hypothetical protein
MIDAINQQYVAAKKIDLSDFDADFKAIEVEDNKHEEIPDGKYQVNIDKAELVTAKISGNPMLKWTLRILNYGNNKVLWRNNVLATKENLKWLKQDLATCGLFLDKLSDLNDNLDNLIDIKLEVTKKTIGDFQNVYLNKQIYIEDAPPTQEVMNDVPLANIVALLETIIEERQTVLDS